MQACTFCKILSGELPSHKLYESKEFLVILDRFPHVPGQTIIIDKKHETADFTRMPDKLLEEFVHLGKKMGKAIIKGLGAERATFMIEGLDVDHAHIKIFPVVNPMEYVKSMRTNNAELSDKRLEKLADSIRGEVDF